MKTFTLALTTAALACLAQADNIRLCKAQNFGGGCMETDARLGACQNVPKDYNDIISSLDLFRGNMPCEFFVDGSCGGESWTAYGYNPTIPSNMNDRISSYRCR
ncbi:hypothetical protein EJ08DRAFT_698882 [Tothia fuscella]|uniref:Uncharacterized protein n=1 Tax=Tothia fuscella TaxID=1048955 RepID=A0A9P4NNS1_9PEZI|nr:hypothetical protein EJ08DRAFT_698882 [Tothia fuscella]